LWWLLLVGGVAPGDGGIINVCVSEENGGDANSDGGDGAETWLAGGSFFGGDFGFGGA
jgi:hypothetical protein